MATSVNFLTPIDLFGELISPRYPGENLALYKKRLNKVAGAMALRDYSLQNWSQLRAQELSGHVGEEVQLVSGSRDPELLAQARELQFTWERLEDLTEPFRWPERYANGDAPLYTKGLQITSGVAGVNDLIPGQQTQASRDLYTDPGIVTVVGGRSYLVAAGFDQVFQDTLSGSTSTVIVPYNLSQGKLTAGGLTDFHGHRISVVSETELLLTASDHTHTAELVDGSLIISNSTGAAAEHTHTTTKVNTDTKCLVFATPRDPRIQSDDGFDKTVMYNGLGINERVAAPLPFIDPVIINTDDLAHESWVDGYSYWSGSFSIGTLGDHSHEVRDWEVLESGEDDHTHDLTEPAVPAYRPLFPLFIGDDTEVFEEANDHPFILNTRLEKGWTVVEMPSGLPDRLRFMYPKSGLVPIPNKLKGKEGVIALGPVLPASKLFIEEATLDYTSGSLVYKVYAEDVNTAIKPGQIINTVVTFPNGDTQQLKTVTNQSGYMIGDISLPTPLEANVDITVEFSLLHNTTEDTLDSQTIVLNSEGGYNTIFGYGLTYGDPLEETDVEEIIFDGVYFIEGELIVDVDGTIFDLTNNELILTTNGTTARVEGGDVVVESIIPED